MLYFRFPNMPSFTFKTKTVRTHACTHACTLLLHVIHVSCGFSSMIVDCTCTHALTYTHTYTHTHNYTHTHTQTYTDMDTHTNTHTYAHIHAHKDTYHTHTCMHSM